MWQMQIVVGITCLFVGALISYFITTLTQRNILKSMAKEIILIHEKVHHKKSIDTAIQEHMSNCSPVMYHRSMMAGIVFLVTKANGNLHDLGLS